tara:strand:+ start:1058 stop:2806 length:1749 start_codon:yes stop_codon:yes gene_type:complete
MYDPKFSQKQMYDQYGRSRPSTKRTDPKPSRSSGFSGMGADPAERFGGSPTKGIGAKPVSRPFERGSTYDEVPTPTPSKPADPSNIEKVKNKFIDLMKSFGAEDPKEVKVDGKAVYKGPMFKPYEGRIVSSYPFMTMKEVRDNIPIDVAAMDARIRDAVDYSKAPPLVYTAYGSTYDEIPPSSANKNLVKNAVNTFLKERGLGGKEYTIKRGDTLSEIAQREGVTVDDLVKINKIEDKDRIYTGETLIIPPPQEIERVKDLVDSVDPDAKFSQSGVPMDQRIFEPELGEDAQSVTGYDDVPQMVRGLMSKTNIVEDDFDTSDVESDRVAYESVKKVQKRLNDLGYTTLIGDLTVDGKLGRGTARQLRKFQATAGLPVTAAAGQPVDEATEKALKNNRFNNKEGKDSTATVTPLQDGLFEIIKAPIAKIESGGEAEPYAAIGGFNNAYDGKYQLGKDAKDTIKNRRVEDADGNMVDVFTAAEKVKLNHPSNRADYRGDSELQEKAFRQLTEFNHSELTKNSAKYRAMDQANQLAVLGYAHNQGAEAALEWLTTSVVGTDAFGTGGDEYSEAITEIFTKDDMLG